MGNNKQSLIFRILCKFIPFLLILIQEINGQSFSGPKGLSGFQSSVDYLSLPFEQQMDLACADIPDSGSGKQLLHVWHFNLDTAQCRELLYRGYGGSANMFATRRDCEKRCMRYYTEGAEQYGPKIKATVDHSTAVDQRSSFGRKHFSHRSIQLGQEQFKKRGNRNGSRKKPFINNKNFDYSMGGYITHGKRAPHPRSLTVYDDQGDYVVGITEVAK